jgi:enamine deaminase RidA (YjgF/YER057c/UK114 family)
MTQHSSVDPPGWKAPSGYSHGISTTAGGRLIVTAGQIGWNPVTGQFESDGFVEQASQALRNVVTILVAAGAGPEHLVRLTWYVTDRDTYLQSSKELGARYRDILGRHYPAMSVIVVSALVEPRALVEIEATAMVP